MLLQHVLQVPRAWLITHDAEPVAAQHAARFGALLARREAGEPMAYLVGQREFMGHAFATSPQALIPRPETELLVETAIQALDGLSPSMVLDLGTGSGAIAVSVALACPQAAVIATDCSRDALGLARRNAQNLGAAVAFYAGDWYDALAVHQTSSCISGNKPVLACPKSNMSAASPHSFDLIISNPPYIAVGDPHLNQGDLRFEPSGALTDGGDGLGALRIIIGGAQTWLKPQGMLWVEHGWDQASAVRDLLRDHGFGQIRSHSDLAGIERVSGGVAGLGKASSAGFAAPP